MFFLLPAVVYLTLLSRFPCSNGGGPFTAPLAANKLVFSPQSTTSTLQPNIAISIEASSVYSPPPACSWKSRTATALSPAGGRKFRSKDVDATTVTASRGQHEASGIVTDRANPQAVRITHGGTYTGQWSSNDPNVPAVTVATDEPVIITGSTITGKGVLIMVWGNGSANLTLTHVTGKGLDPGVNGLARGVFLNAQKIGKLVVDHCTVIGTSFGVYLYNSSVSKLSITNNIGQDFDDRVSDGNGGQLLNRRVLGHFIILINSIALNGGEIAWNQFVNNTSTDAIEDIINIYNSRGASVDAPIRIHDNYLDGAYASGQTTGYTGSGLQTDGPSDDPATGTGFLEIYRNVIVHSAGLGLSVDAGHNISLTNNRVVSCGYDSNGKRLTSNGYAYSMWNFYKTHQFHDNTIQGNSGGLIQVSKDGKPINSDFWGPSVSDSLVNVLSDNNMDHPCWLKGILSQAPEAAEFAAWRHKVSAAGKVLGNAY